MPWPLASGFQSVLQNPRIAFRDPLLQSCAIEKDALGQPKARSGAFAVVYKGTDPQGHCHAIRVFSTESPQRRDRYGHISEHLEPLGIGGLVDFEYREEAIRSPSDGAWYPIVLMEWVEGPTLFQWVGSQCRSGNRGKLADAAGRWLALLEELQLAQIAHGDLQHANVLVTPTGQLRLVDYDGMCVPTLVGRKNDEIGIPPYQHPQRNGDTLLSPRLDDFSALLIYVALRALDADPRLWSRYVEQLDYDRLLFRESDFQDLDRSPLRGDLQKSPDPQVRVLADRLFDAAQGTIDEVPRLAELAMASHKVAVRSIVAMPQAGLSTALDIRVVLDVVAGPVPSRQFVVDQNDSFLIGRGSDCYVRLVEDRRVSRHHSLLTVSLAGVHIKDLRSRNGTFLNGVMFGGRETSPPGEQDTDCGTHVRKLNHGDMIQIGKTTIRVAFETVVNHSRTEQIRENLCDVAEEILLDEQARRVHGHVVGPQIGRGPVSVVYRAICESTQRQVALKTIDIGSGVAEHLKRRFLRETDRIRKIKQENIALLHDAWVSGNLLYLAMEYCALGNLVHRMERSGGKLPLSCAGPLLLQCLDALRHAHAHHLIHGNLTPQNVLLSGSAEAPSARIVDFELAKDIEILGVSYAGQHSQSCFLPRERLVRARENRPVSDLWSLAATFYYALTGQFPYDFQGRSPIDVILSEDPIPLGRRDALVPAEVAGVLDRALRTSAIHRYQSAADMKHALEHAFSAAHL